MNTTRVGKPGRAVLLVAAAAVMLVAAASDASARDFRRGRDDHPLVLARYVLYPAGTVIEYALFRPLFHLTKPFIPEEQCLGGSILCRDRQEREAESARRGYHNARR